ncbi:MAG: hypothetical protein KY410_03325 [Proteobacteria bacterium]|nr:hypothetical protein [Pseudomonadota bacterium]
MTWLAGAVVTGVALGMVATALLGVAAPEHLRRFLRGFASSARAHYLEMLVRVIAGAAFITYSPEMTPQDIFRLFGWIIVLTSAALLLVPWQWHRRFADIVIPVVVRHLPLYALVSLALAAFIVYGMMAPLS